MTDAHTADGAANGSNGASNGKPGRTVKFEAPSGKEAGPASRATVRYSREEIQAQRQALPITAARQRLVEEIRRNHTTVLIGETGSGKTTQIPQYVHESRLLGTGGGAVAVTQPRRVAAVTIAARVADEAGCELGATVGYTVRFEDVTTFKTKIKYLTDGMLLREVGPQQVLREHAGTHSVWTG